tara:strand:+ start:522 stop:1283 length:762 start_codon:yes stop_codon:yes gene_type:complete
MDFEKFNDTEAILTSIKDLPPNKRKTLLSALFVVTSNKKYQELMLQDIQSYVKETEAQEKTETQKANWVETDELKAIVKEHKTYADTLYKKPKKSVADLQSIQNYIILSLFSGEYIAPRRSKDYVDFKIKNINKETDNYLDGNNLVFNSFKTAKTYGQQIVPIPAKLKAILKKWIALNETDYLLFDTNANQLTNVKLTQRFNKIFGKKASINALRHTFLTDKFGDTVQQKKDIDETMTGMGSSKSMLTTYVKK